MEKELSEIEHPSLKVRRCSRFISENLKHIKINYSKLKEFAVWTSKQKFDEYDDSSNHPKNDEFKLEEHLRFIFLVDGLNFCFWPSSMEYEDLTLFIKNGIKDISKKYDPDYFLKISKENFISEFQSLFKKDPYNQLEERYRILQELSYIIKNKFDNSYINFVKKSDFNASKLLNQIISNFTSFQDHAVYKGRQIFFYKRAQILVGDINETLLSFCKKFKTLPDSEKNLLKKFNNNKKLDYLELLTCFADYRVPQVLDFKGIVTYSESLNNKLINNISITPCSEEEIEIRGVMIFVVSEIVRILKDMGKEMNDIEVDWILWQFGEKFIKDTHPHHKVLGIFY